MTHNGAPDDTAYQPAMPYRRVLKRGGKSVRERQFWKKTTCSSYLPPWWVAIGGWRLAAAGGWRLATGSWWWLVVGGWWSLGTVLHKKKI